MIFTDEQMIETGRIRERLEKLRNKIQPYPSLPAPIEELPYKVRGLTSKERDEFSQMKASFLFLERKLNEYIRASKRKPKYK